MIFQLFGQKAAERRDPLFENYSVKVLLNDGSFLPVNNLDIMNSLRPNPLVKAFRYESKDGVTSFILGKDAKLIAPSIYPTKAVVIEEDLKHVPINDIKTLTSTCQNYYVINPYSDTGPFDAKATKSNTNVLAQSGSFTSFIIGEREFECNPNVHNGADHIKIRAAILDEYVFHPAITLEDSDYSQIIELVNKKLGINLQHANFSALDVTQTMDNAKVVVVVWAIGTKNGQELGFAGNPIIYLFNTIGGGSGFTKSTGLNLWHNSYEIYDGQDSENNKRYEGLSLGRDFSFQTYPMGMLYGPTGPCFNVEFGATSVSEKAAESAIDLKIVPNPSTTEAMIYYSLDNPSRVSVKVFDSLGGDIPRAYYTEINNELQTPGKHYIRVDSSKLSSGVYDVVLFEENQPKSTARLVVSK